jgi:phenylalanyl-tRNA synthetase alpha subunit
MEINNINNNISNKISSQNNEVDGVKQAAKVNQVDKTSDTSDKVSLGNYAVNKSEEQFAKIELNKINKASFDKLSGYKAKIQEYQAAKAESPEAAGNTEIGKMLNDPEIMGSIAQRMLE